MNEPFGDLTASSITTPRLLLFGHNVLERSLYTAVWIQRLGLMEPTLCVLVHGGGVLLCINLIKGYLIVNQG